MAFKLLKNESAVSPIVATLVLIVVAVIGAVAVGTLVGAFSGDVADETNTGDVAGASATEIVIAGSTTVQPASEVLAKAYMADHPGIKITVQGGGSGAGIAAAQQGLVDIGSASKAVDTVNDYPDLTSYTIGGSAVVVIGNADTVTETDVTAADLLAAYRDDDFTGIAGADVAFDRAEDSGTEETFAKFIGAGSNIDGIAHEDVEGKVGNAGMLKAVEDTDGAIGFVDYGFADGDADVVILGIMIGTDVYTATSPHILESLKGTADDPDETYVASLTRPLNYLVKGNPNPIVKSYIDFCRSPGAIEYFEEVGYVPYVSFA